MSSQSALPNSISLAGKTAIVTGGSRGIGAGIALELASRGANVALVYHSESSTAKAEKVAAQIAELGRKAALIRVDLSSLECGQQVIHQTLAQLKVPHIDILVNNAAADPPFRPLLETDFGEFERSSILTRMGGSNLSIYTATKSALEGLTRHWAHELAKTYKLTVNTIALGEIAVDSTPQEVTDEFRDAQLDLPSAARRFGTIEEVAQVAAFLASAGSSWINGGSIPASGGSYYW
ncbi:SDR family NAD(P)-dependent oxidoreductase [Aspergillus homomorphus CBS 101889]|uniref:NAD(P)-binding protein n=1 Tax=Aspergillus homomorphus (strain CBS 101889) TaxID=1450537 RepID=A0A395HN18_ASPHC|nr:NAD(P)-binding protein [Aspergillus homomorphus CBS 101889]RAL08879.1 NAD(P)-binding protein [Aspergillus homomorphus CBS 101889]